MPKQSPGRPERSPGKTKQSSGMPKQSPSMPKQSPGTPKLSLGTPKQSLEKFETLITLFLSSERREKKSMLQSHILHPNLQKTF